MSNPLNDVWDGLWSMAEANSALTTLVRANNRIKYDDTLGPKREITEGDLPELALLSSGADINIKSSSTSSKMSHQYTWSLATGEFDIKENYYPVFWELYRSMMSWDTVLCALQWPSGWNYVTNVQIATAEEGTTMLSENRNIRGWAGILVVTVEMHFNVSDLRVT